MLFFMEGSLDKKGPNAQRRRLMSAIGAVIGASLAPPVMKAAEYILEKEPSKTDIVENSKTVEFMEAENRIIELQVALLRELTDHDMRTISSVFGKLTGEYKKAQVHAGLAVGGGFFAGMGLAVGKQAWRDKSYRVPSHLPETQSARDNKETNRYSTAGGALGLGLAALILSGQPDKKDIEAAEKEFKRWALQYIDKGIPITNEVRNARMRELMQTYEANNKTLEHGA